MRTPRPFCNPFPRPRLAKSSRTRRKHPFYPRPILSRYWRLVDDGQARRVVPPPHLFDLWITILAARRLPYRLAGRGNRLRLYVPALLETLARAELAAVAAETHKPAPQPEPPARHNAHWVLMLLLALISWHGVRMHWGLTALLPGVPDMAPELWLDRGAVDVFRVTRLHEWYRCVTALTLHADSQHLFGNVLFGAPFLILLCRRVGLGLGLAMIVLAGTLGNALNVLYRPADHVSLGFSTALFGTVGALSGFLALQGWRMQRFATPAPVLTLMDRLSWRRGILLLAAGTGILAMLGTEGVRTDYAAHLFGLLAGFSVGGGVSVVLRVTGALSRTAETLLGLAAALVICGAWQMAL
ncbi:MAG: rhomboid family intramembrane serine protease [Bilophila sp.]